MAFRGAGWSEQGARTFFLGGGYTCGFQPDPPSVGKNLVRVMHCRGFPLQGTQPARPLNQDYIKKYTETSFKNINERCSLRLSVIFGEGQGEGTVTNYAVMMLGPGAFLKKIKGLDIRIFGVRNWFGFFVYN